MNAPVEQHLIDPEICIRGTTCEETCPVDAIPRNEDCSVVRAGRRRWSPGCSMRCSASPSVFRGVATPMRRDQGARVTTHTASSAAIAMARSAAKRVWRVSCVAVAGWLALTGGTATADDEMSNVAHVAAGPSGRCYARSVPKHVYDPDDDRQAGTTSLFTVKDTGDTLARHYDWFSQQLLVLCDLPFPERSILVRVGPWPRGDAPRADHLALAFYASGRLVKRYATKDIVDIVAKRPACPNDVPPFLRSVSHYSVLGVEPRLEAVTANEGPVFHARWRVRTSDLCGRPLLFDPASGELIEE